MPPAMLICSSRRSHEEDPPPAASSADLASIAPGKGKVARARGGGGGGGEGRGDGREVGGRGRLGGAARTEGPDQLDVLDLVGHRERGGGREAKIGEQRRHVRRVAAVVVRLRRVLRPSTSIRRGSAGSAAGKPGGATQRRLGERRWRTGESRRRSGEIGRDRARGRAPASERSASSWPRRRGRRRSGRRRRSAPWTFAPSRTAAGARRGGRWRRCGRTWGRPGEIRRDPGEAGPRPGGGRTCTRSRRRSRAAAACRQSTTCPGTEGPNA